VVNGGCLLIGVTGDS